MTRHTESGRPAYSCGRGHRRAYREGPDPPSWRWNNTRRSAIRAIHFGFAILLSMKSHCRMRCRCYHVSRSRGFVECCRLSVVLLLFKSHGSVLSSVQIEYRSRPMVNGVSVVQNTAVDYRFIGPGFDLRAPLGASVRSIGLRYPCDDVRVVSSMGRCMGPAWVADGGKLFRWCCCAGTACCAHGVLGLSCGLGSD